MSALRSSPAAVPAFLDVSALGQTMEGNWPIGRETRNIVKVFAKLVLNLWRLHFYIETWLTTSDAVYHMCSLYCSL